jgi:nicotinate-nucleotide adenylyltransferase
LAISKKLGIVVFGLVIIMLKRVGFFGGTFDPIHLGHICIAIELMELHKLDRVCFCPTYLSPHKTCCSPTPGKHRFNMVKLAIADIEEFFVIEDEIYREFVSYTFDTLSKLVQANRDVQYHLLLGEDCVSNFHTWYKAEELIKIAPPLVAKRFLNNVKIGGSSNLIKSVKRGMTITTIMPISSTVIRDRLKQGLYCNHLLAEKILDYILDNKLYLSLF